VQGMTFLHSRNLMHRELKTRSIFFDEDHCVKIGGFGRSKFDDLDVLKQTVFDTELRKNFEFVLWRKVFKTSLCYFLCAWVGVCTYACLHMCN
jgi:serine/threonine protein kinase